MQGHSKLGVLLCVLLVSGGAAGAPTSEKPKPNENGPDAATVAKDLAALKAFRRFIASHSYHLPDERLREIVLTYLKRDKGENPKSMPTMEQVQETTEIDFESLWDRGIKEATTGLDPDGQLGLADRLRGYLKRNTRLRKQAERRHGTYVTEQLPQAIARAEGQLVDEQRAELGTALTEMVAAGEVNQERIGRALDGDSTPVAEEIVDAVKQKLSPDLRHVLLAKSVDGLQADVEAILEDGVAQLEKQMLLFELRPDAISLPGMEKEFDRKLALLAGDQKRRREGKPLRPAYGEFTRAKDAVKDAARRWFDERVAENGTQIANALIQGEFVPAKQDADTFREKILRAPVKHYDPQESWQALQPAILATCANARIWISGPLEIELRESSSQTDRKYSLALFREDLRFVIESEETKSHRAWESLNLALKTHFKEKLLPELRTRIAEEQAIRYAPRLMDSQWIPTEGELTRRPAPLTEEALTKLSFWAEQPASPKHVLKESWFHWKTAATEAFTIGDRAMRGQAGLVDELEPAMLRLMRSEEADADTWTSRYAAAVSERWKRDPSDAARRYPALFVATKNMIAGIVAKLADKIAKEREAAEARKIAEEAAKEDAEAAEEASRQEEPASLAEKMGEELPTSLLPSETETPSATAAGSTDAAEANPERANSTTTETVATAEDVAEVDSEEDRIGESGDLVDGTVDSSTPGEATRDPGDAWRWNDSAAGRPADDPPGGLGGGGDWGGEGGDGGDGGWYAGRVYKIGFWFLLFLVFVQGGCWYWNFQYLREYIAARRRGG